MGAKVDLIGFLWDILEFLNLSYDIISSLDDGLDEAAFGLFNKDIILDVFDYVFSFNYNLKHVLQLYYLVTILFTHFKLGGPTLGWVGIVVLR